MSCVRSRSCSNDNKTIGFNDIELQCIQDGVQLGHHYPISTVNKTSLVGDTTPKFWKGCNMFLVDFNNGKSTVMCTLFPKNCCSFYGAPLREFQGKNVGKTYMAWRNVLGKL